MKILCSKQLEIIGGDGHYSKKGNGISFYNVKNATVTHSLIQSMQDGIYLESSEALTIEDNQLLNGRYGIHFMYSNNAEVMDNRAADNVTGMMVMMVDQLTIHHNTIEQQNNLNSNGVFLYEVSNVDVQNNVIRENTIGLILQKVVDSSMTANSFYANGTAVQAMKSGCVSLRENTFSANILSARSDAEGAIFEQNTYDDYKGNDFDGNGIGDTAHALAQSFGQWMIRQPSYQYFIESPSVVLLNTLDAQINHTSEQTLTDSTPKITEAGSIQWKLNFQQLLVGISGLLLTLFLWRKNIQ